MRQAPDQCFAPAGAPRNAARTGGGGCLRRRFARALLCACGIALSTHADATVLIPADFATVVNGSQVIVHGRVVAVRSGMSTGRRSIESLVTVAVEDTLKGEPARAVTFRVPNGQVGRYRRIMVGAPEFEDGDEVIVFLRAQAPAMPTLFGLGQGVYRVASGAGGERMVAPPPVIAHGAGPELVVRGDPSRRPLPIAAFVAAVRAATRGEP